MNINHLKIKATVPEKKTCGTHTEQRFVIRVFELLQDEEYIWKDEKIYLFKDDTFCGGKICSFPAARDYFTVRNKKRIWFSKDVVENSPDRFRELFV